MHAIQKGGSSKTINKIGITTERKTPNPPLLPFARSYVGHSSCTYLEASWSIGAVLGPGIGGLLADPAKHHPLIFSKIGIFGT